MVPGNIPEKDTAHAEPRERSHKGNQGDDTCESTIAGGAQEAGYDDEVDRLNGCSRPKPEKHPEGVLEQAALS